MLNKEQQEAVQHLEGPLLVLAGAGSGKTRVVTQRIAHLIEIGIPSSEILAVTFTNKAAGEMKRRVQSLTNAKVMCVTFHSLGARILREMISSLGYESTFTIYDEDDAHKVLKDCMQMLSIKVEKAKIRSYKSAISSFKNNLLEPHQIKPETEEEKQILKIYELYQTKLKSYNALDFDDLLFLTVKLLREDQNAKNLLQKRWQFFLVDEYQDTNTAQYELTALLSKKSNNLFVVGDPDQSIYSWRGAQYQNILNFGKDYPNAKIINLEQNYRSSNIILKAANAVIQNNEARYEKNLWSAHEDGEKIALNAYEDDRDEASAVVRKISSFHRKGISYDQMVIFYRTNAQSRSFEDQLLSRNVPYIVIGGISFYQRREIKDILAFLKLLSSNNDYVSFMRTINMPKRGLGLKSLEKIHMSAQERQVPLFSYCHDLISDPNNKLLTTRQKSGLKDFVEKILDLRSQKASLSIAQLIENTLLQTGYLNYLKEDPDTYEDRKENIDQLIAKAKEYQNDQLEEFLEEITLKSSAEQDQFTPSVHLMTIHHGKGLEFPIVFVTGLEEDLFPHVRAKSDSEALEEERRLFYVALTRAKTNLFLSLSQSRYLFGSYRWMTPSRFVREIPKEFLIEDTPYSSFENDSSIELDNKEFLEGDKVVHKDFGVGVVQKGYETSMGKTYEVFFDKDASSKTLVAKYAKLKAYKASDFSLS